MIRVCPMYSAEILSCHRVSCTSVHACIYRVSNINSTCSNSSSELQRSTSADSTAVIVHTISTELDTLTAGSHPPTLSTCCTRSKKDVDHLPLCDTKHIPTYHHNHQHHHRQPLTTVASALFCVDSPFPPPDALMLNTPTPDPIRRSGPAACRILEPPAGPQHPPTGSSADGPPAARVGGGREGNETKQQSLATPAAPRDACLWRMPALMRCEGGTLLA